MTTIDGLAHELQAALQRIGLLEGQGVQTAANLESLRAASDAAINTANGRIDEVQAQGRGREDKADLVDSRHMDPGTFSGAEK